MNNSDEKITFTAGGNTHYIRFRVGVNHTGETAIYKNIMFNAGSAVKSFEPYTGGAPSPSPDYPQEIVSKAEDGNVEVDVLGSQLFDYSKWSGITINRGTGQFVDNGVILTATGNDCYTMYAEGLPGSQISVTPGNLYTLSWEHSGAAGYVYVFPENGDIIAVNNSDEKITFTAGGNTHYIRFRVGVNHTGDTAIYKNIMFNTGPEPLLFELYKTPQTLTVSTPNGLPGIPVTSGGNYTDETGQQWVCDEVDFERGAYVQRVKKVSYSTLTNVSKVPGHLNQEDRFSFITGVAAMRGVGYSNQQSVIDDYGTADNSVGFGTGRETTAYARFAGITTLESLGEHLNQHPLVLLFGLTNPLETPLTPVELSAYAGLHTNYPTTTVVNDEGVYMALDYAADTETYIANNYVDKATYNTLEDRVEALEGAAVSNV